MELNKDQSKGLIDLLKWEESNSTAMALIGYAGTGKTTLINEYLKLSKYKYSAAVTAPTHKAREVANAMVRDIECTTIHKLCGLKLNLDLQEFSLRNLQFALFGEENIGNYKLVIIDECSMINTDLYDLLMKKAIQYNVKLLFIGDPLQLPPIEKKSKKLNVSQTFEVEHKIVLKQIMRTDKDNPITNIVNAAKKFVVNQSQDPIIKAYRNSVEDYDNIFDLLKKGDNYNLENDIGYTITDNKQEFIEKYLYFCKFNVDDRNMFNHVKYGAWTNKSVNAFNYYIHEKLFGKDLLYPNEKLIGNKTCTTSEGDVLILNSKEYIVDSINKFTSKNMELFRVKLLFISDDNRLGTTYIHIVHPNSYNVYKKQFNYLFSLALKYRDKNSWRSFFNFVNEYHILEDLKNDVGEDYTSKPELLFKNMAYSYGVTIHKLQGSSITHMFVNYKDILLNKNTEELAKLLYVAFSRARQSLHILV